MKILNDQRIIQSWGDNATPWIVAIKEKQIESRRLVTDKAIIGAIVSQPIQTILDIGCGEGWLTRELSSQGIKASGLDAIPELIDQAKTLGTEQYQVMAYEEMATHNFRKKYDAAVCNFSLLGKESVEHVFKTIPQILNTKGLFIVQTLHPKENAPNDYTDGWQEGTWEGFSNQFREPAPWYFRTLESWHAMFQNNGFTVKEIIEPINPTTRKAASLILIGCTNE